MFSTGIFGSASWPSTRSQKLSSVIASDVVKKRIGGTGVDPLEHEPPRHLVPVIGLAEHVVVRIATVHLRGDAVALARQFVRRRRLTVRS